MNDKTNIFLEKSYQTIWEDWQYSLSSPRQPVWDWVFITASNEMQAESYRMQIDERLKNNYLPAKSKYIVIADPDGKRIGSGGATLNVLKYISEHSDKLVLFGAKILVIHSGGDSRRIPQYSACGKLFSPVPRQLSDGRRSVLFDEIMVSLSALPNRMNHGMLVISGDTLLLFNPFQIDFKLNKDAVAISIKKPVGVGVNHGVFLSDERKYVKKFLHKQPVATLRSTGAADENNNIDLDTGAVWFDKNIVDSLFSLISSDNNLDTDKFNKMVSENVRLSFYGDFLYPLASEAVYEEYMESAGEIPLNAQLLDCRKTVWDALGKYKLSLIKMSPAKFIHFGTTRELHKLVTHDINNYSFLNWSKSVLTNISAGRYAASNSYISPDAEIGDNCYIEDCYLGAGVKTGDNAVLSNVRIDGAVIPGNIVMHGIELNNNKYCVRIYGINDNPKDSLETSIIKNTGITSGDLWTAALYPVCDTAEEAFESALLLYRIASGATSAHETKNWEIANKTSLEESFREADIAKTFKWKNNLENIIRVEKFIDALKNKIDIKQSENILSYRCISEQIELLLEKAENCEFSVKFRIYQALSYIFRRKQGVPYIKFEDKCYDILKDEIIRSLTGNPENEESFRYIKFIKDEASVELPARINWGGGWSDTIPYCIENGGTVLNAAVKLKGKNPIKVTVKKIPEKTVRFKSVDLECEGAFSDKEQILNLSDAGDPFLIHKGALISAGIIKSDGESLESLLDRIGGGIFIASDIEIPKGSGLGTSSIFACACVKALYEIFGLNYDNDKLYSRVLLLEQLIGSGGGWQDQAGGISSGLKLVQSQPGVVQHIAVDYLKMPHEALEELKERFALVYSGQQRFAKNILREMMNKYILSDTQTVEILYKIQRLAVLMRFELEKGDISAFAKFLSAHYELSKRLDKGSSNICIDLIFELCEDLIDGRFICGAGGGGFLQMILKKGVSRDMLRERLAQVFYDSGVEVWDCEFV